MSAKEKIMDKLRGPEETVYNENAVNSAIEVVIDFINVVTDRLRDGDMTFKEIVGYHDYLKKFSEKFAVSNELVKGLNAMMHAIKQVLYQGKGVELND